MATLLVIIGGAIANAVAFTGGQALFHSMQSSSSEAERSRHDRAVEQLNKASIEWSERRKKTQDYLDRVCVNEQKTSADFRNVDEAFRLYNSVMGEEPKLSDFYMPSETQKQSEYLFIIGGVIISGAVAYKMF